MVLFGRKMSNIISTYYKTVTTICYESRNFKDFIFLDPVCGNIFPY